MNHDAQAAARAGKGVIHWKTDRELISKALLGNGLLIASRMLPPFQARSLQVKKPARELGGMGSAPRRGHIHAWWLLGQLLVGLEPFHSLGPSGRVEGIPLKDFSLHSMGLES